MIHGALMRSLGVFIIKKYDPDGIYSVFIGNSCKPGFNKPENNVEIILPSVPTRNISVFPSSTVSALTVSFSDAGNG